MGAEFSTTIRGRARGGSGFIGRDDFVKVEKRSLSDEPMASAESEDSESEEDSEDVVSSFSSELELDASPSDVPLPRFSNNPRPRFCDHGLT